MEKVPVARTKDDKLSQRKFFFWYKSEYRNEIVSELKKLNRDDLIEKLFGKLLTKKGSNPTLRKAGNKSQHSDRRKRRR